MLTWLEKLKKHRKKAQRRLVFKALLVGLGVVLFWRGTWNLLDHLIFPQQPIFSALVSLIIGLVILFFSNKLIDELM